jgi:hypothetical protein
VYGIRRRYSRYIISNQKIGCSTYNCCRDYVKSWPAASGISDLRRFWLFCFDPLVFLLPKTISYLVFQLCDLEHTWWRLFQKCVVHVKLYIYILLFITTFSELCVNKYLFFSEQNWHWPARQCKYFNFRANNICFELAHSGE